MANVLNLKRQPGHLQSNFRALKVYRRTHRLEVEPAIFLAHCSPGTALCLMDIRPNEKQANDD